MISENHEKSYGQSNLSLIDRLTIKGRIKISQHINSNYEKQIYSTKNTRINVLELGCGYNGFNLIYLSKIFPAIDFTGVDVSVKKTENPNVNLVCGDIEIWQPKLMYDVVLSLAVIEHLTDPSKHFHLIKKCLNPDGKAILTTPTPFNHIIWSNLARFRMIDVNNIDEHKLYLTRGGIYSLAVTHDLSVIQYKQFQLGLNQYATLAKNDL